MVSHTKLVSGSQLASLAVTMYLIVLPGEAYGSAIFGLLSPVPGIQVTFVAPESWSCTTTPLHTAVSPYAWLVVFVLRDTITVSVFEQLNSSVPVTV